MMRDRWQKLLERFSALSLRERWLVVIALVAVAYQAADLLILERQFGEIERLNKQVAQDNAAIVRLNSELNMLSQRALDDPNKRLRVQIEDSRSEVQRLQARLQEAAEELISPQDMARLLEQMLVQQEQLTMLRLQTLEVEPLLNRPGGESDVVGKVQAGLHRHGFSLEFSGGYLATLNYLEALERLPWRFFWDSVDYEVMEYPQSIVRLKLYTLSLSEDWIGV
jgi:MSHA biogenesis protein MshJ